MSIIERAVEKLASQDKVAAKEKSQSLEKDPEFVGGGKHEAKDDIAEKAGKIASKSEKGDTGSFPELNESVMQQHEDVPAKSAVSKTVEADHQDSISADGARQAETKSNKPEIAISRLGIEGVLSSKGGRTRLAEEYRLIKRPLLVKAFSAAEAVSRHSPSLLHNNVIMVTSSVASEGKTFTSLNLAISIAMEMDQTVLLIDSDLAKPGLSKMLGIDGSKGLTDYLSNDTKDLRHVLKHTDIPKLTVMGAGTAHGRSTELLTSRAMERLLNELATRYPDRIIIFDTPPLLATTESVALARQMGQICLVVESALTPQYVVKQALALLHSTESVSLILNKVKPELLSAGRGYYGYGYGYGNSDEG